MRVAIALFIGVAALWSGGLLCSGAPPADPAANKRVLYITLSAGFHHQVVPLSANILKDIGQQNGFDVTATDDVSVITTDGLKPYDAIAFYTTGELPISDEQKKAFLDFVKSSKGILGFQSATDTFYKCAVYADIIGGD